MIDYRKKIIGTPRFICTGNPDKKYTIASAVKKRFPDTIFLHNTMGIDLTNLEKNQQDLLELFSKCNTLINASYIGPYVQNKLLTFTQKNFKIYNVFNIGSTHEYDRLGDIEFCDSKNNLKELSLSYNSYRFRTCHITLGSIKVSEDIEVDTRITVDEIIDVISLIMEQRFDIPAITIDHPKDPW